ncbi:MAG TPA: hypothetical protein VMZ91_05000 [Candidatus Paceibacterota bacterium]|nr:hypothetical protein [Candidatus Paceibacterota bacterium]
MKEQPHYLELLTKEFFEKYYLKQKMSFPDLSKIIKIKKDFIIKNIIIIIEILEHYFKVFENTELYKGYFFFLSSARN